MWKTVVALLITLIIIPWIAFRFDEPLSVLQKATLLKLVTVYLVAAFLCFIVSTISKNHSQVDKLWSIMPVIYSWIVAFESGFESRLVFMAILVTIWGFRLTYNFSRRGGYSLKFWSGEEDYRWGELRKKPEFAAGWKWFLFNLLFISVYQMGLILLITLPSVRSMGGALMSWADGLVGLLLLLLIGIETIADQQQWNYHREKHKALEAGGDIPEPYKKGFVHTGLWASMRHPNYAAEQAVWIVFYFFSVLATGVWLNWSIMGAILLVLLFWGSSNFSESITLRKYPEYTQYRTKVRRFLPF